VETEFIEQFNENTVSNLLNEVKILNITSPPYITFASRNIVFPSHVWTENACNVKIKQRNKHNI